MGVKYYIDDSGRYLGGWDDNPPEGAVEVEAPPEWADQVWQFPGWGESVAKQAETETLVKADELVLVADQLLRLEDDDPTALPGTARQWRDYRIALRAWSEGAEHFPDLEHRPQRPA